MTPDIQFRTANESDIPALVLLFRELETLHVASVPEALKVIPEKDILAMFQKFDKDEKVWSVVAEVDNNIVGFVRYRLFTVPEMPFAVNSGKELGQIDELVVTEKFRRQGLAKKLYQLAENDLKDLGAPEVQLMVWGFNDPAKELYDSVGFDSLFQRMRKSLNH